MYPYGVTPHFEGHKGLNKWCAENIFAMRIPIQNGDLNYLVLNTEKWLLKLLYMVVELSKTVCKFFLVGPEKGYYLIGFENKKNPG